MHAGAFPMLEAVAGGSTPLGFEIKLQTGMQAGGLATRRACFKALDLFFGRMQRPDPGMEINSIG